MSAQGGGLLRITVSVAALMLLAAPPARAGFVGGVERFDGTVKDTVTWQEYVYDNDEVISQNNALVFTDTQPGNGNTGDYTTRLLALLPGSSVSVKVTPNGSLGVAGLFLTTNSTGSANGTPFDSHWAELSIESPSGIISSWIGGNGNGTGAGQLAQAANPVGQTFTLEIIRPNDKDFTYRAYNAQGTLLGATSFIGSTARPEGLFISLHGINGMSATWDDVTVSGNVVPEPAGAVFLAGAAGGLVLGRRRQR